MRGNELNRRSVMHFYVTEELRLREGDVARCEEEEEERVEETEEPVLSMEGEVETEEGVKEGAGAAEADALDFFFFSLSFSFSISVSLSLSTFQLTRHVLLPFILSQCVRYSLSVTACETSPAWATSSCWRDCCTTTSTHALTGMRAFLRFPDLNISLSLSPLSLFSVYPCVLPVPIFLLIFLLFFQRKHQCKELPGRDATHASCGYVRV